jgi:hypothetical protein
LSALDFIHECGNLCITFSLSEAGNLRASGPRETIAELRPRISANKAAIVAILTAGEAATVETRPVPDPPADPLPASKLSGDGWCVNGHIGPDLNMGHVCSNCRAIYARARRLEAGTATDADWAAHRPSTA